jgi:hypothetical protein
MGGQVRGAPRIMRLKVDRILDGLINRAIAISIVYVCSYDRWGNRKSLPDKLEHLCFAGSVV